MPKKLAALIALIAALAIPSAAAAQKHARHHHATRHAHRHHVAKRADACGECDYPTPAEEAQMTTEGEELENMGRTPEEIAFSHMPITPESPEEERQYEGY